jgi:hypothetical protein
MATVTGELKIWHKVRIECTSTASFSEQESTFKDYRMNVTFTGPSNQIFVVPGYFAADGNSEETSATSGNKWFCDFSPNEIGNWDYSVSFRTGTDIAAENPASPSTGTATEFNGEFGTFSVGDTDKDSNDFRSKGRLQYVDQRYLQFQGSGEYFLKAGADSPETFLAYDEFDNTVQGSSTPLKDFTPHVGDWSSGDPEWQTNKGRGIIGALNYLNSVGANAQSMLLMNVDGDGDNVWPWASGTYSELVTSTGTDAARTTYDCSKLAQWQIVFDHAQSKGIFLHFKLHETENDSNVTGNSMTTVRKIYYREMIARFGYLLAINWNLGEESNVGTAFQKEMATFFKDNDPYQHHRVLHTFPDQLLTVYPDLVGNQSDYTGGSFQCDFEGVGTNGIKSRLETFLASSEANGKIWAIAHDEQVPANVGVAADDPYSNYLGRGSVADNRDETRKNSLWATLMGGGWGVEYYYGYNTGTTDLNAEDHRSRATKWADAKKALDFFNSFPFWLMNPDDSIVSLSGAWAMKRDSKQYVVYLPNGGTTNITTGGSGLTYNVKWYDPRNGGPLQDGSVTSVSSGTESLGPPPNNTTEDWAILVTLEEPEIQTVEPKVWQIGNNIIKQMNFGNKVVNV